MTTGTLTFSDIQNQSHYDATSNGISAGVGVGSTGKAIGPGSVGGTGGVSPMMSQNESDDSSATTRSATSAGSIDITNQAAQTQDVSILSRDTTNTNGTVAQTPDVNAILNQQADTMQAAQAAGQVVAQGIGAYADMKEQAAKNAGDSATAAAWTEGGDSRAILQAAGGALIGGLGGGSVFTAVGGAAGAGLASMEAQALNDVAGGVESATGSALLGNIAGNVVAGVGGALVGGTAGAATASNVQLYNQQLDPLMKRKSLVPSTCTATGPCNESVMTAQMNATGANAQAALNTTAGLPAVTAVAGVGGTFVLGYGISAGVGFYLTPGFGNTNFDAGFYATYGTGYGFDPSAGGSVGFNKGSAADLRGVASNVNTAVSLADVGVGGSVTYSNGQATGASYGVAIKGVPSVAGGTASVTNMTTCTLGISNITSGLTQSICK
ncbi:hypothetical protein [Paraburkholderia guartelaensis]|uniref:Cell surface protein n=1 Tax=Paraburkholderia guartelaensis TaxID=2546446 RepID=A0ABU9S579_9BURK